MSTADLRVRTRDELTYLLTQAAELEHLLTCVYLFAAFSLKRSPAELGGEEDPKAWERWNAVNDWTQTLLLVARQEMEHLALANNLLTAIGGAPHFGRPNFPQPATYFPRRMTLERFSEDTIKRFVCFERPEGKSEEDAFCFDDPSEAATRIPALPGARDLSEPGTGPEPGVAPRPIRYHTVVELYSAIRRGFHDLDAAGVDLFIGPPEAQVVGGPLFLNFPRLGDSGGVYDIWLFAVTDLASADRAIDLIIEQGEGAPEPGEESHYERFLSVLHAFERWKAEDPGFDPARPVVSNPVLSHDVETPEGTIVTHPDTRLVMDLFNGVYETLLLLLIRFSANTDETEEELSALRYAAFFPMMTMVIRPLAEVLVGMPAFEDERPDRAGPSFEMYRSVQFLPHKEAAWVVLEERMDELSRVCRCLADGVGCPEMSRAPSRKIEELAYIAESLELTTRQFSALLDSARAT